MDENPVDIEVKQEADQSQNGMPKEPELTEEEEVKLKLPFPTATIVRLMKKHMDGEKMIKREVKIAMNKWLGKLVENVSVEMNKFPYVMMHLHEFQQAVRKYENLEEFQREKERILAHLNSMKQDIEKLERDLGKLEPDEI